MNKDETSGFRTNLSITGKSCNKTKSLFLRHLKRNIDSKLPDYEKDRELRRKYQKQLYYKQKTYERLNKDTLKDTLKLALDTSTYNKKSSKIVGEKRRRL